VNFKIILNDLGLDHTGLQGTLSPIVVVGRPRCRYPVHGKVFELSVKLRVRRTRKTLKVCMSDNIYEFGDPHLV
jgi:hypothetical protein